MPPKELSLREKVRLYQAREAFFNRINPEIRHVIDLDKFLQATVEELGKMTRVDRCVLICPDEGGAHFTVRYEYRRRRDTPSALLLNIPDEAKALVPRGVSRGIEPIVVEGVDAAGLPDWARDLLIELKSRSALLLPISFRNSFLGLLGLHHCARSHVWNREEREFVKSLSTQVAVAFQYTKLFKEKEEEAQVNKILLEVANEINSKVDSSEIAFFVVDKAVELLKADYGAIGILDRKHKTLLFGSVAPLLAPEAEALKGRTVSYNGVSTVEEALASGRTLLLREGGDPVSQFFLGPVFPGSSATMTPITVSEKTFGVISLVWQGRRLPFSAYELQLVEGICNQATISLEKDQLQLENLRLREELKGIRANELILGKSDKLKKCIDMAIYVADSTATVLLQGESGTGKELLADLIQRNSPRADERLVKINCGAIPETLIESELFGHERGAFTDATHRRIGKFEEADRGTLFLDEVGELSASAQVKLLRMLQFGEFNRVGGNETIKVDVRVIAATNQDLEKAVQENRFRTDLFYRLNVFLIKMPALRERREDIPLLAHYFLEHYMRSSAKHLVGIMDDAMRLLSIYNWPGNVRELENAIEHAVIVATDKVIRVDDLPESLQAVGEQMRGRTYTLEVGQPIAEVEKRAILETLAFARGNKRKTAEILGIGAKTLYRKLEAYELDKQSGREKPQP